MRKFIDVIYVLYIYIYKQLGNWCLIECPGIGINCFFVIDLIILFYCFHISEKKIIIIFKVHIVNILLQSDFNLKLNLLEKQLCDIL